MGRITINLNVNEETMKKMIEELRKAAGNPYSKRSESEVAKMILEPALLAEHHKYIKDAKQALES